MCAVGAVSGAVEQGQFIINYTRFLFFDEITFFFPTGTQVEVPAEYQNLVDSKYIVPANEVPSPNHMIHMMTSSIASITSTHTTTSTTATVSSTCTSGGLDGSHTELGGDKYTSPASGRVAHGAWALTVECLRDGGLTVLRRDVWDWSVGLECGTGVCDVRVGLEWG